METTRLLVCVGMLTTCCDVLTNRTLLHRLNRIVKTLNSLISVNENDRKSHTVSVTASHTWWIMGFAIRLKIINILIIIFSDIGGMYGRKQKNENIFIVQMVLKRYISCYIICEISKFPIYQVMPLVVVTV